MSARAFKDFQATIQSVIEETSETKSFILDFGNGHFDFIPGQCVNLTQEVPGHGRVRRAYSIASSPLESEFCLTVKRMEGGLLSTYLCDSVRPGDDLDIRGPHGNFTLEGGAKSVVFIAGGSGIVPFRSMWRYIVHKDLPIEIQLIYASKSPPFVIYRDELESLRDKLHLVYTFTRDGDPFSGYTRRIDKAMLVECVRDFRDKSFYVCGPPAMCNGVVADLVELSVERSGIKTEKYD